MTSPSVLSSAAITFDPVAHEYRLPSGCRVPSVTEVLSGVGISRDFDALAGISHRVGQAIDLKRDLGTAVHADAHAYDDNDLDWATVDLRVAPFLRAWAEFREAKRLTPVARERLVYHPIYSYAGTLDGIFALPDGRHVLIDLKLGDPDDAGCCYQTAAYLEAYAAEHPGVEVHERWGVQLTPERTIPYRVSKYGDWTDFACFQSFLTTYRCQADRRKAAHVR